MKYEATIRFDADDDQHAGFILDSIRDNFDVETSEPRPAEADQEGKS